MFKIVLEDNFFKSPKTEPSFDDAGRINTWNFAISKTQPVNLFQAKKRYFLVGLLVMIIFLLMGCFGASTPLGKAVNREDMPAVKELLAGGPILVNVLAGEIIQLLILPPEIREIY